MTADRISVGELQGLLAAGRPVTVVDVRSPSDVDWEIPGSIHLDAYGDLQSGRLGPLARLARLAADEFVEVVLARIPPNPPNHSRIIEFNERGELPADPGELEAGANRCAID